VIDRLCRLALSDYEAWRRQPDADTRVAPDGPMPFRDARLVEPAGAGT
jgi:hypothetical protein